MAIESVVSKSFQLDLFGVVVRVQTVKTQVVDSYLDTSSDHKIVKRCRN